jgi:hypothetical protein
MKGQPDSGTSMTAITLTLPERTMKQAQQAAAALQRPLEDVLADMLTAVLPAIDDFPADMQIELTHMTWLDNQALWDIARSRMPAAAQKQLQKLTQLQDQHPLTAAEQQKLDKLRREYGHVTLRKARAYALLSLRGGEPLLSQI